MIRVLTRRRTKTAPRAIAVVLAAATVVVFAWTNSAADAAKSRKAAALPTIVLVHGAFADASGWGRVTQRLQRKGYTVVAPTNTLRGVIPDAAYMRSFLGQIHGPIVLVGHSYGGVVITNAATGNPNVKALVYVAAYAPDEGDTVGGLETLAPGGMIGEPTLDVRTYPAPDGTPAPEATIKPRVFHDVFAADLPTSETDLMATEQRPAALSTLGEPSGPPAWKTIPSWYVVAGKDNAIGTAVERIMAKRIDAHTTEVKGASHVVMMSRPAETTKVILDAAQATS
jgi:pimeloyl-ACP methyl ester carboxylesterase